MLEWLLKEFDLTRSNVRPVHAKFFEDLGISVEAIERAGGYGVARIRAEGGAFEVCGAEGISAIVLPVYTAPAASYPSQLYDLVAFAPKSPDTVFRRRSDGRFLGEGDLETARFFGQPIALYRTPLSWLKSGGRGATALSWDDACPVLAEMVSIECEDAELQEAVRTRLMGYLLERLPEIRTIPEPVARCESAPDGGEGDPEDNGRVYVPQVDTA